MSRNAQNRSLENGVINEYGFGAMLELPIEARNFGSPKLSENRFGIRTDISQFFGQFRINTVT